MSSITVYIYFKIVILNTCKLVLCMIHVVSDWPGLVDPNNYDIVLKTAKVEGSTIQFMKSPNLECC